nr:lysozyme inhibitor LprI family protein [Erwinia sp. Ejp617]
MAAKNRVESTYDSDQAEKKQYLDTLLVVQRAWLKYREYDCRLAGYAADKGTNLRTSFINMCITDANLERIKKLKEIPYG